MAFKVGMRVVVIKVPGLHANVIGHINIVRMPKVGDVFTIRGLTTCPTTNQSIAYFEECVIAFCFGNEMGMQTRLLKPLEYNSCRGSKEIAQNFSPVEERIETPIRETKKLTQDA